MKSSTLSVLNTVSNLALASITRHSLEKPSVSQLATQHRKSLTVSKLKRCLISVAIEQFTPFIENNLDVFGFFGWIGVHSFVSLSIR